MTTHSIHSFTRIAMLMWALCCCLTALCAKFSISGSVIDENQKPIENALFSLISTDDKDTIFNTSTTHLGTFFLDSIPAGDYRMRVKCDGYKPAFRSSSRIDSDLKDVMFIMRVDEEAMQARQLEEVEVIAKALQTYADHDVMYLSSYNRNYGVNALDAISSLPRFIPQINGGSLTNNKMETVNILINGRRASTDELRNLTGKDIEKVIYYQDAPAKYRGLYGGAVANVILKKPKQLRITGKVDASTALNYANTTDGVGFTLMNPTGLLNANYSFSYNNNTGLRNNTRYDYGDLVNSFNSTRSRIERKSNSTQISYQLDLGKNLYFAKFGYSTGDAHNHMNNDLSETTAAGTVEGRRTEQFHPYNDVFFLNLYYSHQFDGGRELMADVVGTISKSHIGSLLQQTTGTGSAYDDYTVDSSTDALVKSVIANLSYSTPLWGGSASVSLYNLYRHMHQDYINNFFPDLPSLNVSEANNSMISIGYTRSFGRLGTALTVMAFNDYLKTSDGKKHNVFYVYPRLNLNYNASQVVNLQLEAWMEGSRAGIGQQNVNRTFIDTRYYRENIPYRLPSHRYNVMVSADFQIPSANLMITPMLSYTHERHSYIDYVYNEDGVFVSRPTLLPNRNSLNYILFLIWSPVRNLDLRPYLLGDYTAFRTPAGAERYSSAQFRLVASYTVDKFQFQAFVESPKRNIDGITRSFRGWNVSLNAYYEINSFYAGVSFNYAGQTSWQQFEVPGFSSRTEQQLLNMRNNFAISLGYNFQIGNYDRKQLRKKLNNRETDNGL